MKTWLRQHARAIADTFTGIAHAPFGMFLTVTVIGITLALPAGLYLAIDNATRVVSGWESGTQLSLFLKTGVKDEDARRLAARLKRHNAISQVDHVSREQALEEFKRHSGLAGAIDALGENPLPNVLIVRPAQNPPDPAAIDQLSRELSHYREVEEVLIDMAWVQRLSAWLAFLERGVWLLAALLALAVLLIVGNTARLAVLNRREEIVVVKLVGGTNAYIHRPFLYAGLLQGLLGALLAWLLITAGLALLAGPLADLTRLYGSSFSAQGLTAEAVLLLIASGGVLGWLGARLAVGKHLRAIEPV